MCVELGNFLSLGWLILQQMVIINELKKNGRDEDHR